MPETVLPPPHAAGSATAGGPIPRMSTPQQDNSWAGWAISSFTNKIAAATGEIQPNSNGSSSNNNNGLKSPDTLQPRSSSMPPPTSSTRPTSSTSTASTLQRQALKPTTTFSSDPDPDPEAESEDFGAAWGDDFDDPTATTHDDDDDADAWGDPFSTPAPAPAKPAVPFDDNGEPDFAGWLTAQAAAKGGAGKKPLPKGLAKSTARPGAGQRASTTGSAGAKKTTPTVAAAAKKKVEEKKVEAKKEEEMDEGWGDAWD